VARKSPVYHSEGSKLRRLARSPGVEILFGSHADRELEKDNITRPDALAALASGTVVNSELHGLEWRRTVRGHNRDGDEIMLVVTVDYDIGRIEVVTGWRVK